MGWNWLLILFIIALVCCAVGFYKYVYFLSIGYGFAIAGCGIGIFCMAYFEGWHTCVYGLLVAQTLLFIAYGARLSGFLLVREIKNAAYRKTLKEATGEGEKKIPVFVLVFMWIFVSALYVAQDSAMFFRYYNQSSDLLVPVIGIAISVAGLLIETLADKQKSDQKKENPDMVATKGLYRISRCPNYWGEITFWTGVFVSGLTTYTGAGQWITAIVAYVCIFYIMVNGAQRLEKRQNGRYGEKPEYKAYVEKTPILLPFIPIKHLTK